MQKTVPAFLESLQRALNYLYILFIKPHSLQENGTRREVILNIILFVSFFSLLTLYFSISLNLWQLKELYNNIPSYNFYFILFVLGTLITVSRKGHSLASAIGLVCFYIAIACYGSLEWEINLPEIMLAFAIIIVLSSILVSARFGFYVTVTTSAYICAVDYGISKNLISPNGQWGEEQFIMLDTFGYIFMIGFLSIVSWLSNYEIGKSLLLVKTSKEQLKKDRSVLEFRVKERERELAALQQETMANMYRFCEFGKLSAGIFHDLANPLTAIEFYVEKIKDSQHPNVIEHKYELAKAFTATKKMGELIARAFKQMQNREVESLFNLENEILQVLQLLHYKIIKHGIKLICKTTTVYSWGNPLKFYKVALNLISNAIDACEQAEYKIIIIGLIQEQNIVTFSVEDSGSGIIPENIPKIFDPFFTTKSNVSGFGMGLSLTKEVIEKDFLGKISVQSKPNENTIFTVTFPTKASYQ